MGENKPEYILGKIEQLTDREPVATFAAQQSSTTNALAAAYKAQRDALAAENERLGELLDEITADNTLWDLRYEDLTESEADLQRRLTEALVALREVQGILKGGVNSGSTLNHIWGILAEVLTLEANAKLLEGA